MEDFYNVPCDFGALGLASPSLNENALDFSNASIQSSLPLFEELNTNHGETDVFADWMDEKMDLSILDGLEGQLGILDDLDGMVGDPLALLDNLIDWSCELLKNESGMIDNKKNDLLGQNVLQVVGLSPPVSPCSKVPDSSFDVLSELRQDSLYQQISKAGSSLTTTTVAPDIKLKERDDLIHIKSEEEDAFNPNDYLKVELCSPATELDDFTSSGVPLTPTSIVSSANEYLTVDSHSPANTELNSCVSSTPPLSPASFVPSVDYVGAENSMEVEANVSIEMSNSLTSFVLDSSFNNNSTNNESQELIPSVKESDSGSTSLHREVKGVTKSVDQTKKCRSRKKAVPTFDSPVPVEVRRRERKRVQNKDAATRYREKKRKESKAVMDEELTLEKRNKELHNTVDRLSSEISYLKGLLKEAKLRAQSRQKTSNFNSPVKV